MSTRTAFRHTSFASLLQIYCGFAYCGGALFEISCVAWAIESGIVQLLFYMIC